MQKTFGTREDDEEVSGSGHTTMPRCFVQADSRSSTAMKSSSSRWAGMSGCNINAHIKVSEILQLQKEVVTALRSINQKQKRHIHSLRAIITKQKETVQNRMRVYHAGSSQNQNLSDVW